MNNLLQPYAKPICQLHVYHQIIFNTMLLLVDLQDKKRYAIIHLVKSTNDDEYLPIDIFPLLKKCDCHFEESGDLYFQVYDKMNESTTFTLTGTPEEIAVFHSNICILLDDSPDELWTDSYNWENLLRLVDSNSFNTTRLMRESWLSQKLVEREEEYENIREEFFYVVSFNVNNKDPADNLEDLFKFDDDNSPLFICVGLQEIDLSATGLLAIETSKAQLWIDYLLIAVNKHTSNANYSILVFQQLVGVFAVVFVKSQYEKDVTELAKLTSAVGFMGVMANKGGIAIKFKIFETTFLFINSHLAASQSKVQRRNQDAFDILNGFRKLSNSSYVYTKSILNEDASVCSLLDSFDYTFFIGDLNYRIDCPIVQVYKNIIKKNIDQLVEHDQLLNQSTDDCILRRYFTEEKITFFPTYKFTPGTSNYHPISDEKQRIPSYCDRILYHTRAKSTNNLISCKYDSISSLYISDHKPVYSLFKFNLKETDPIRQKTVMENILLELDELEMKYVPSICIDKTDLVFSDMIPGISRHDSILVKNDGNVSIEWCFNPLPGSSAIIDEYCSIFPTRGILFPNDVFDINLKILIPPKDISSPIINKTLLLKVINGDDHYINLKITLHPCCIGVPLQMLCSSRWYLDRISSEKRKIFLKTFSSNNNIQNTSKLPYLRIPRELWMVVDSLKDKLDVTDIFLQTKTNSVELESLIKDLYNNSSELSFIPSVDTLAEFLFLFLESLPNFFIVDFSIDKIRYIKEYDEAIDCISQFLHRKHHEYNLLVYLLSFFHQLFYIQRDLFTDEVEYYNYETVILLRLSKCIFKQKDFKFGNNTSFLTELDKSIIELLRILIKSPLAKL
eukprot:TRINITY_DN2655_c0_g1_i1.p1 TRINITY_DN2655_c0_g1~~TRINITY_DN2655_c0_g1_i1.p1  ORF type:complete len:847 (-),score=186.55 TRINITY_DN2655_c0_g1_i1:92-2632(-)